MKIEKIFIENFGKLSNYTLDFKDGLNCIFGNNEDGKTTVMSFIRLMFYSDCGKKSDISANIRHRFRPLSGSEMGGSIDFTHKGKSYTLIKKFGKTARADKVMLLDRALGTQLPVSTEKEIGEEFFSMGCDAFERSIYIGSLPIMGDGGYAELSDKLAAAQYTGSAGDGYEQTAERITNALSAMRTPRKVGITDKLEREIEDLKERLRDANIHENERLLCEDRRKQTEQLLKSREGLLKKAEAAADRRQLLREKENRALYEKYRAECKSFTAESIEKAENLFGEYRRLKAELGAGEGQVITAASGELEVTENALLDVTARIEETEKKIENQASLIAFAEKRVPADGGKRTAVCFVLGAVFAALALLGFFVDAKFFFSLIPAVICFVLAFIFKSAAKKSALVKSELLALKETEGALKEELTRLLSDKAVYTERLRLIKQGEEDAKLRLEKLEEEQNNRRALLADTEKRIAELLGTESADESVLQNAKSALANLNAVSLVLNQSNYSSLSDEELEKKLSLCDTAAPTESVEALRLETDRLKGELIRQTSELRTAFSGFESPAVLERELLEKQDVLEKHKSFIDALLLAREVMEESYYEMRKNFAPRLNALTAQHLNTLTNGKYGGATVSNEFRVLVNEDGAMPMESELLSNGSRDQLDLCIRLALAELTSGENLLPLMLDDILIQYDAERSAAAFKLISEYASDRQVLFFTCHRHIELLAKENNAALLKM